MISLKGKFVKYIYQNAENDFSVAIFKPDSESMDENNEILLFNSNIVVSIKNINIPINKTCLINIINSKSNKYQDSFELVSLEENIIDSTTAAIDYLSSKKFKNITKPIATKIINSLGIEFLNNPENYLDELKKIISEKKIALLVEQINNQKIYQKVQETFAKNNLSMRLLYLIEKEYKDEELINFLETDVYSVLEWEENVNFFDVDNVAEIFLKGFSNDIRLDKYICWSLVNLSFSTGSTIFEIKDLYFSIARSFGMTKDEFLDSVKRLVKQGGVILSDDKRSITANSIAFKEAYIAKRLIELNNTKLLPYIGEIDNKGIDKIQSEALTYALNNPVTIISGYPGTGKTTLVDKFVKCLTKSEAKSFSLLAPTGKAAYQIFLKTGYTARTIHSFLGMKKGSNFFRINAENPSHVKTLIVDEFSMINIDLFYSLLIGCPFLERIILIGDKNQLPSIGAGYLLNDFIASKKFKTFLLEKIYRQEHGSEIIDVALSINNHKMPIFNGEECIFIEESENIAKNKIIEKIDDYIKNDVSLNDYQILVPMYSGECGIDKLNILIQEKYSKGKEGIEIRNNIFYLGDKVIQIENDNDANVFNGEIGFICEFNARNEVTVEFEDGKIIKYNQTNFIKNIKLAYAISVHKFQGSEAKNIILVMYYSHFALLSKKLLYTAITRAAENLIIFGEKKAIEACIKNDSDSQRIGNILTFLSK
ncbi:MAG: SF1B family DNA helicase RecD2 [Metamycoplasmataceae bacterium]